MFRNLYILFSSSMLLVAVLLSCIFLSACGGGDPEDSPDKTTQPVECTACKK